MPQRNTINRALHSLFLQHCAIIIQSRFKAYLQRKKYKSFLPLYRRVQDLLYAIYRGWKLRNIMNLPIIKSQVAAISIKTRNNQFSSSRIAKRQLIDDIQRLQKKGKWVQYLAVRRYQHYNQPLYNHLKSSKTIRNVFKKDSSGRALEAKSKRENEEGRERRQSSRGSGRRQGWNESILYMGMEQGKQIPSFDEMPIQSNKDVFNQRLMKQSIVDSKLKGPQKNIKVIDENSIQNMITIGRRHQSMMHKQKNTSSSIELSALQEHKNNHPKPQHQNNHVKPQHQNNNIKLSLAKNHQLYQQQICLEMKMLEKESEDGMLLQMERREECDWLGVDLIRYGRKQQKTRVKLSSLFDSVCGMGGRYAQIVSRVELLPISLFI